MAVKVGDTGPEHSYKINGKSEIPESRGPESGPVAVMGTSLDDDLQVIVAAWPKLPEALRDGIRAMIDHAAQKP
jgi:hypothetical protein